MFDNIFFSLDANQLEPENEFTGEDINDALEFSNLEDANSVFLDAAIPEQTQESKLSESETSSQPKHGTAATPVVANTDIIDPALETLQTAAELDSALQTMQEHGSRNTCEDRQINLQQSSRPVSSLAVASDKTIASNPPSSEIAEPKELPFGLNNYIEHWIHEGIKLAELPSCQEVITALTSLNVRWNLPNFRLAFVGEFSRGKSTLINRLLECDLLPVGAKPTTSAVISILPGSQERMEVRLPDQAWSIRTLEESTWDDLLVDATSEQQDKLTQVRLTLNNSWLKSLNVELIDTPGAGDLSSSRTPLLFDVLSQCDAVVVLVSATLPFSLTEAAFLEQEVLGRHIPNVLVAVSRLDTVPQEQRVELLEVIRDRIVKISNDIPILPIHPLDSEAPENDALALVRTQVEAMVAKGERKIWRSRKVVSQLVDHLDNIIQVAESALEIATMDIAEKEQKLHQIQEKMQDAQLIWKDMQLSLDQRRLTHNSKLKARVSQLKEELLEHFSFELRKTKDLKTWWEQELPFNLRRQLTIAGNEMSSDILNSLAQDLGWLRAEVAQKFCRKPSWTQADSFSMPKVNSHLTTPMLTEPRHYQLLTRLAGSAGTICAFIGAAPVVAAISITAWFVSDAFISKKTEEQKRLLTQELDVNLEQIMNEYSKQMSSRIREIYTQLLQELQQEQTVWQSTWETALNQNENLHDLAFWHDLIDRTSALKREIQEVFFSQIHGRRITFHSSPLEEKIE